MTRDSQDRRAEHSGSHALEGRRAPHGASWHPGELPPGLAHRHVGRDQYGAIRASVRAPLLRRSNDGRVVRPQVGAHVRAGIPERAPRSPCVAASSSRRRSSLRRISTMRICSGCRAVRWRCGRRRIIGIRCGSRSSPLSRKAADRYRGIRGVRSFVSGRMLRSGMPLPMGCSNRGSVCVRERPSDGLAHHLECPPGMRWLVSRIEGSSRWR